MDSIFAFQCDYIPEENQRLRMYKRVAGVETETQLSDVRSELEDRYGEPARSGSESARLCGIEIAGDTGWRTSIERKRDLVSIKFRQNPEIDPGRLAKFVSSQRGAQFAPDGTLKFVSKAVSPPEVLAQLRGLLEEMSPSAHVLPSVPS